MRTPARADRAVDEPELLEPIGAEAARAERLPTVAIVGRPNVGKSTLFNRLIGRRSALVHERPGMTRDRRIERVEWGKQTFALVDTGGFDTELDDPLLEDVVEQASIAIEQADAIVLLTAVGEARHPAERALIERVRRSGKPIVVAVNKCDNPKLEHEAADYHQYGFDEVHSISALHGRGMDDMVEALALKLEGVEPEGEHLTGGLRLAVVGRQNVGKSSLINRILGEERVIAGDLPGTTRDAIDTTFRTPAGDVFTLIDTAGIRRRGKIERGIEKICALSSVLAIRRADVAAIVVDGSQGLTAQDAHIAGMCIDEGVGCMLVVNKWDMVEKDGKTADRFTKTMEREWPFLKWAPVVYTSAISGQRVGRVLEVAKRIHRNAGRRIPTARLNQLLEEWIRRKPPAARKGRTPRIRYVSQARIHPPTFVLFTTAPELIHFSYQRHLVNRLRGVEDFEGTPIRLILRQTSTREKKER
jgi:GTP-binding protein